MFVSTPTYGAQDSVVNLSTAWYYVHHPFPVTSRSDPVDLGYSGQKPCYAFQASQPADCETAPSVTDVFSNARRIANYPPPFFWIVGAGELITKPLRQSLASDGGRLAGLLASVALLFLAAWRLHRSSERSALWALYLLTPPIAAFLMAGGNPNGWEIACALLFMSTLLWRRKALLRRSPDARAALSVLVAGLLLATARPSGGGWLILFTAAFVIWFRAWRARSSIYVLAGAILPGVLVSVIWNVSFPYTTKVGQPVITVTIGSFLSQVAASFQDLSGKFVEAWGVLGWLDTVPSAIVVIGFAVALIYFLPTFAPTRAHRGYLAATIALVFVVSSSLEAINWKAWPSWWQGRYSTTLLVGLSLLLFSDPGRRERPRLFALAGWVSLCNAYMLCLNFWRYDYGIANGFPAQVTRSAYGPVHSGVLYVLVVVFLLAGAALLLADRAQRAELADAPRHAPAVGAPTLA
jgi:chromate transport protein ChrA